MNKLSPDAQAVLTALTQQEYSLDPDDIPNEAGRMASLAAASLRAAADQVVPPALEEEWRDRNQALPLTKMVEIRLKLLAIADELEAQ